MTTTLEKVIEIMEGSTARDDFAGQVTAETSLTGDAETLGLDSLDNVEITMSIEEHYDNFDIPDDAIAEMQNLGDLCTYIEEHCDNYLERNEAPYVPR